MVENTNISAQDYLSSLKTRVSSIKLNSLEKNQRLRKTCFGLCRPTVLNSSLLDEYHTIVKISKLGLDPKDKQSYDVLRKFYKILESSDYDAPDQGAHWENIGFQNSNPSTDLRSVGLLALLHLLSFLDTNHTYARSLYLFVRSEGRNIPFAVLGINLSKLVLDCMREGRLNYEFNMTESVHEVMNNFYQGLWHTTIETIKAQKPNQERGNKIMEFYKIMETVERRAQNIPSKILRRYESFLLNADNIEANSNELLIQPQDSVQYKKENKQELGDIPTLRTLRGQAEEMDSNTRLEADNSKANESFPPS